jgi:DNA mismatch repair protein MSH2
MASRPELRVDDEGGFIRFFKNLPTLGEDIIRVFDRGDWYTAHGNDATFVARTVRDFPGASSSRLRPRLTLRGAGV